ncbi:MAG: 4-oxalocrotonate decarboxylase [Kangiellaceae bacterium]|jgi:2-keto-4-pentenoate hydratase|nr:4-oxalocrotonate decarboxylase [Kangiellaceae bacterium]
MTSINKHRVNSARLISAIYGLTLLIVTSPAGAADNTESYQQFAKLAFTAQSNRQPLPHIADSKAKITNTEQAYQAQASYVSMILATNEIAGFKAGLTSSAGQQKFKVTAPLSGVLFKSVSATSLAEFSLDNFNKLMLETEIGFRLNKQVTQPVKSIEQLKTMIATVHPVIELPELGFKPGAITGLDLIATNVASNELIIGSGKMPSDLPDLNKLTARLLFKGKLINSGRGSDALEDQYRALLWLINHNVKHGYAITPQHILITGALGKMLPAQVGAYQADFEQLGTIDFKIK